MTCSLMLCTYNRLELTKRMIGSLFKNTPANEYRLIIVDNGSSDGTQQWLNNLQSLTTAPIHLQFNKENKGIAIGRNQCLLLADEFGPNDKFLCTLDNDIEVFEGWLQECQSIIQDNPKIAIGINFENVQYPLITRNNKEFQLKPRGNLGTACAMFHRYMHQKLGFFNTEYGLYGEEDADIFYRARVAGWEMGYLKKMGVHFGEGELDIGEYREFKDACRNKNLEKFRQNCMNYSTGKKSLYLNFSI